MVAPKPTAFRLGPSELAVIEEAQSLLSASAHGMAVDRSAALRVLLDLGISELRKKDPK